MLVGRGPDLRQTRPAGTPSSPAGLPGQKRPAPSPHDSVMGQPRGSRRNASVAQGRSISQVVGTIVSFAAILPFDVQPQPVPSSSNFWPGFRGPNERRYMSWKNW